MIVYIMEIGISIIKKERRERLKNIERYKETERETD